MMQKKLLLFACVLCCFFTAKAQILVLHDIPCTGQNSGALIAAPAGWGTSPYRYLWNTGDTTQVVHNLVAGIYSVIITDSLGADSTFAFTLSAPDSLRLNIVSITPSDCDGHNNGAAAVAANGGIAPYTFQWNELSTDSVYTGAAVGPVRGGNYKVVVMDSWGCISDTLLVIPNLAVVPVSFVIDSFVCNGLTGSVRVQADNAAAGNYFTYSWTTPFVTENFTTNDSVFYDSGNFLAGSYLITTTELATGCANYSMVTIGQTAAPLVVSSTVIHNQCYSDLIGSISLAATGGLPLPDYECIWTGPAGFTSTSFSIAGLASGDYVYTVSDDSACSISGTIRIEPFVPLQGHVSLNGVSCDEGVYGQAAASFSGGSGILNYLWSNGETTPMINLSTPGTFFLTVTDSRGCQLIDSVTVSDGQEICLIIPNMITPNGDGFNDVLKIGGACDMDDYLLKIFTSEGEEVFTTTDCKAEWNPLDEYKFAASVVLYIYIHIDKGGKSMEYKKSLNINF